MKRKTVWLSLIAISLFVFLAAHAQNLTSAATISRIGVQPGPLNTRVVLEADSPVQPVKTYYSGRAVVLEFNRVDGKAEPRIELGDPNLVQAINLEETAGGRTVVELNRIQRGSGAVEAEAQRQLNASALAPVLMNKLRVEETAGELQFRAPLSAAAETQVFTLEKPLRLVVDVFNAIYEETSSTLPVERCGLKKARVAQFRSDESHTITRLVFDLSEPRDYDLRSENSELVVAFLKGAAAAAPVRKPEAPAVQPVVAAPAAVETAAPPPQEEAEDLDQEQPQEQRYTPKTIAEQQTTYTGEIITLKFKD